MIDRLVRFWNSLSWTSFLIGLGVLLAAIFLGIVYGAQIVDWLARTWSSLTWKEILVFVGLFLLSVVLSFVAIAVVMVKIPANYFSSHYRQDFLPDSHWTVRWGAVILKNILGVFLILLGIVLSLPGVPGQGILTILLGLIMLDIPGKRPLEARIIKRPAVLSAVNKLRKKYDKPELVLD